MGFNVKEYEINPIWKTSQPLQEFTKQRFLQSEVGEDLDRAAKLTGDIRLFQGPTAGPKPGTLEFSL